MLPCELDDSFLDGDRYRNPSLPPDDRSSRRDTTVMVTNAKAIGWRGAAAGLALASLLGFAGIAGAQPRPMLLDDETPVVAFAAQRGGISLAQATAIAQSRYQGRVVSAKTIMAGDRVVHEIRILGNDGRVRTVRIDAQTGSFL
jgi:hypothetical protein